LKHTFDPGNKDFPRPTISEIGLDPLFEADWFSVMSYSEDYPLENTRFDPATPMLLDLLALQFLYGPNLNTGAGNDTYQLERFSLFSTIWDASGLDRVDASNANEAWNISLPDLQLSANLTTLAGVALPVAQDPRSNTGIAPQDLIWLTGNIENATGSRFGDLIEGNRYQNDIWGGGGDDSIRSFDGDDTSNGGSGNDLLDGGEGTDTAVYSGNQSSYTLQFSASGTTIIDRRPSQDGTDILVDIENLHFLDGTFDVGIRSGATGLSANDFAAIAELYIAYFDRAPASKGLLYWATRLEDGMTLPEIAESFFVQPETQRTYEAFLNEDGSLNNTEAFVSAVFNNVLGRDPNGPYWVEQLENNPSITPAIFILAVLNGAKAETGGAADREYLSSKTDIGVYFSAIKGLSDRDDTVTVMEIFDGSSASVNSAVAAIDQIHSEALDPINGEFLMPLVGVIDDPFLVA
jgi:Ca2+-binding RTX toxin-like protein